MVCTLVGYSQLREEAGSPVAQELLRTVAHGIRAAFREYDYVGRTEEATFTLVLPGMKREALVSKLARLDEITEASCKRIGHSPVHCVIGEAFYPEDGDGARQLLSLAEGRLNVHVRRHTADLAALRAVVGTKPARKGRKSTQIPVPAPGGQVAESQAIQADR